MRKLTTGVPQGSVLGPLMFLLYINDLAHVSKNLEFKLFADDTTVLYSNESLMNILEDAAIEMNVVFDWFFANKLCVNVDKTHFMFFAEEVVFVKNHCSLNHALFKLVQHTKFLGIHIDDKLNMYMLLS